MSDRFDREVVDEALETHEQGESALRRWPEEDQVYVVDVLAAEVRALRVEARALRAAAAELLDACNRAQIGSSSLSPPLEKLRDVLSKGSD